MRRQEDPDLGEIQPLPWHRLLGLTFIDFLTRTPLEVLLEIDLSLKKQLLDMVILRKQPGEISIPLPDGLDNLSDFNLLSYKSLHGTLDLWSLTELLGHLVNYCKQVSPSPGRLLPMNRFRLYGISTRFPRKLQKEVKLEKRQAGVYEVVWGPHPIRVLVLSEMPREPQNAIWELFSGVPAMVQSGARHYQARTQDTSTILDRLWERYRLEGIEMPYTMEDFRRENKEYVLRQLTPEDVLSHIPTEELLRHVPPEERLRGLPAEERLRGLPAEERLKGLPAEERLKGLPAEERLKGLPAEEIEAYVKQLRERGEG